MMRLRAVAEQTKIELSRRSRAVVRVDEIAYGPGGAPLNLQIEITRDEFVAQVADIIDETFPVCKEALRLAGLGIDGIDDVILVGGTTKIPYVRDQVSKFFSKAPRTDVNPEDAVAVGAALQATSLERILSRKPTGRIPTSPGAAVTIPNTAPGDLRGRRDVRKAARPRRWAREVRPPGARPAERPTQRGAAIDRFEEPTTGTGRQGPRPHHQAAAPPRRRRSRVDQADHDRARRPPGTDEPTDRGRATRSTRERHGERAHASPEPTRPEPARGRTIRSRPSAQPTLTFAQAPDERAGRGPRPGAGRLTARRRRRPASAHADRRPAAARRGPGPAQQPTSIAAVRRRHLRAAAAPAPQPSSTSPRAASASAPSPATARS